MVVNDLHVFSAGGRPPEADPPLVVDANRMLPSPVPFQGFKMISGWRSKVIQLGCIVDSPETAFTTSNQIWWKALRRLAFGDGLDRFALKRNDQRHPQELYHTLIQLCAQGIAYQSLIPPKLLWTVWAPVKI
jgi:hypothetical protein